MHRKTVPAFAAALILSAPAALAQIENLGEIPDTVIEEEYTLEDALPDEDGIRRMVVFRALDKVTGRAVDLHAPVGVPVDFGTLTITARYCYTVPPEEPPETSAFVQIDEREFNIGEPERVFSGWMFESSPALNALEHGVYDVWVINCITDAPPPQPPELPVIDPFAEEGAGEDGGAVVEDGPALDAPSNE